MSRGAISEELQVLAKNFLGKELSIKELRLLPYIHYCLVNQQGIDPAKINSEERKIIIEWKKKGYLEGGMKGLRISKDFLNFINECLKISYITQEQILDEEK